MALNREQIEHLEHSLDSNEDKGWKKLSHSRKWFKKQLNKFIRIEGKKITEDSTGGKKGRKPYKGYEY